MIKQMKEYLDERLLMRDRFVKVFENEDGRKVLRFLCKKAGVTSTTFVAGDPYATAYKSGQRDLMLAILGYINKDHATIIDEITKAVAQTNGG